MAAKTNIDALCHLVATSDRILAFTGAGISNESGIPTYRGHGGTWTQYDPDKYASIVHFRRNPSYFWRFYHEVSADITSKVQPNGAHLALAELERCGKLLSVVTQNVDDLHQRAGSKKVRELHGNATRFYCMCCRKPHSVATVTSILQHEEVPHCSCKGVLRPDIVFFGERLPRLPLQHAVEEAQACDLCLVIGSSLVVQPAASIPYHAWHAGAKVVVINIDPTPIDKHAELVLNLPAAKLLTKVVETQLT